MDNRSFNQPPIIDLNTLDEEFEVRMEYDSQGNLTRIRKVRRNEGCATWIALVFVGIIAYGIWYVFLAQ